MRAKLEALWGAAVTEAMGIGDIAASLWGECEAKAGMHFSGRGFVHFELIDPATGTPVPLADGAEGELVYTHLDQQAAPLLRFRSRDHVVLWTGALRLRTHGAARPLHRAHRRHADRARRQRLPLGAPRARQPVRARGQRRHLGPPARSRASARTRR